MFLLSLPLIQCYNWWYLTPVKFQGKIVSYQGLVFKVPLLVIKIPRLGTKSTTNGIFVMNDFFTLPKNLLSLYFVHQTG